MQKAFEKQREIEKQKAIKNQREHGKREKRKI